MRVWCVFACHHVSQSGLVCASYSAPQLLSMSLQCHCWIQSVPLSVTRVTPHHWRMQRSQVKPGGSTHFRTYTGVPSKRVQYFQ